jgi:heme/copper-type cytochrome/quinol oxidase subunit 4
MLHLIESDLRFLVETVEVGKAVRFTMGTTNFLHRTTKKSYNIRMAASFCLITIVVVVIAVMIPICLPVNSHEA